LELTPIKENYNIRFYYDNNKKIIDYYIDISLENGIKYKMPYYIDLYLDIIHYPKTDKIAIVDEEELKEALDNKIVSKKDYELAYRVGNKLIKEIKENSNKYMNINILEYVNRYF
jgi:predicted RNA-binding protein associated with RNAse of E/G family